MNGLGSKPPAAQMNRWLQQTVDCGDFAEIKQAIETRDLDKAADLLFEAWYESGSIRDYYAWGETHRKLIEVYKEAEMHERLIFQLCYSATFYEHGSPQDGYDALEITKELGRETNYQKIVLKQDWILKWLCQKK